MSALPIEVATLAERGMRLFPVIPNSKKPVHKRWQLNNNTSDLGKLETWQREYPGCNWGVLCGPESGVWVGDFDCKHLQPGLMQYQRWIEEHGPEWTYSIRVRTPSGGLHVYLGWRQGIRKDNKGKLASGVDIQGLGAYVVIPPSTIDGKPYRFEDSDSETDIASTPEWLYAELQASQAACALVPKQNELLLDGKTPIPEGKRHNTLIAHLGRLRRAGAGLEVLQAEALRAGQQFSPPESEHYLLAQAEDVFNRYPPEPGGLVIIGDHSRQPINEPSPEGLRNLLESCSESLKDDGEEPECLVEDLLPEACNLAIAAKIKRGKTTFILDILRHVIQGSQWCGRITKKTRVLYLSEQPKASFNFQLRQAGLDTEDMHILYHNKCYEYSWPTIAKRMVDIAAKENRKLIVVDTLGKWAKLEGERENTTGGAQEALSEIGRATTLGITNVFLFHSPKGDERAIEDSIRGSGAFGGAMDQIYRLRFPNGQHENTRHRILETKGRFDSILSDRLSLEYADRGDGTKRYVLAEDQNGIGVASAVTKLKSILSASEGQAMTVDGLVELSGLNRTMVQRALRRASVERIGGGKRSDPHRYFSVSAQLAVSKKQSLGRNENSPLRTPQDKEGKGNSPIIFQEHAGAAKSSLGEEKWHTPRFLPNPPAELGQKLGPELGQETDDQEAGDTTVDFPFGWNCDYRRDRETTAADDDRLFVPVVAHCRQIGWVGVSDIMGTFGIPRIQAIHLIDRMEEFGLVGPANGSGPRTILQPADPGRCPAANAGDGTDFVTEEF